MRLQISHLIVLIFFVLATCLRFSNLKLNYQPTADKFNETHLDIFDDYKKFPNRVSQIQEDEVEKFEPTSYSNTSIPLFPEFNITLKPQTYNNYCLYANVYKTQYRAFKLPMILHTSANYFGENLLLMANSWEGRISLAIFASSGTTESKKLSPGIPNTVKRIYDMVNCNPSLKKALSAHIFVANTYPEFKCPTIDITIKPPSVCDFSARLKKFRFKTPAGLYPVNTARNVARMCDNSEYFLYADMEQQFSDGAEAKLRKLIEKHDIKRNNLTLTIRRFEHKTGTNAPRTLEELNKRYHEDVFVFHSFFWKVGHWVPDLNSWMDYRGDEIKTVINIKKLKTTFWEPMFVAHRSIPFHDERILYGKENHVSLALHLCCAGYKFAIVPEVFNSHEGIHRFPIARPIGGHAWFLAKRALWAFYRELADQYPTTSKKCLKGRHPNRNKPRHHKNSTVTATTGNGRQTVN
ncbi:unnamed protein product [Auanema sp. JU1783]|nr:unnamed protein product [Auanema sp. JU1783]